MFEDIVDNINQTFTFAPLEEENDFFTNLERVYSFNEMNQFMVKLIENSDIEVSKRLKSILTVKSLVEVRNQLEQRLTHYFDNNIRE